MKTNVLSVNYSKKNLKDSFATWIEVNLTQFKKNLEIIHKHLGQTLYCLPVKANAYGHGLCEMAKVAEEAGVHYLGVSSLQEGARLRREGILLPILVFGAFQEEHILDFIHYDLEFTISSLYKAQIVQNMLASSSLRAKIHLEIETGMNRTGARPITSEAIYQFISKSPCFDLKGMYSHFASSDNLLAKSNNKQQNIFYEFIHKYPKDLIFHMANSGALRHFPKSFLTMARPGLLSFGIYPSPLKGALIDLKSCFILKSRISYFKVVESGEGISYGHTYVTPQRTRIVTVPIGYGDGYRRALSNKADVLIRGKRFPVVGSICMDQLMVDIGEEDAYVGDEVVLIGTQGLEEITLHEIAKHLDTIPYEVLTGFNERVKRMYCRVAAS
ncbi:MAG: Alanine racemase [Chlamydiae bacterium]|nr:Alanine racemase [Chlamydiota bacterium]